MRNLIQRWLGIYSIQNKLDSIVRDQIYLTTQLADLKNKIVPLLSDLTTILRNEHDPLRKKLSDQLGARAIARLEAEDKARRHTLGEL